MNLKTLLCTIAAVLPIQINGFPSVYAGQIDAELAGRLVSAWSRQDTEIQTGVLKINVYRGGHRELQMTHAEAAALLQPLDDANLDDAAVAKTISEWKQTFAPDTPGRTWYWGEPITVTMDGQQAREEWTDADSEGVNVFDGVHEVQFTASTNQYSLFSGKSNMLLMTFDVLRYVPDFRNANKLRDAYPSMSEDGERLTLSGKPTRRKTCDLVVDSETGFVYSMIEKYSGLVQSAIHQLRPVRLANGVMFPSVVLHISCRAGNVVNFECYHIRDMQVNVPVSEESFVVAPKPGTMVVDYRKGTDILAQYMVGDKPQKDVFAVIANQHPNFMVEPEPVTSSPRTGRRWIFVVNMIVALSGLTYFVYRRNRGGSRLS